MPPWLTSLHLEPMPRYEFELENEMRTFFRRYYTHSRYISATATPLDNLNLDAGRSVGTSVWCSLYPQFLLVRVQLIVIQCGWSW